MLKATSMALAAFLAAGLAHAQSGPTGDLSKFSAGRDLAPNAGTFSAAQPSLPGTDVKYRLTAPTGQASGEPSMAMNAGMSAPQGAQALPGLNPQMSDNTFGSKPAAGTAPGATAPAQIVPASTGLLGVENSNVSGNLNASTFGAANSVKLGK